MLEETGLTIAIERVATATQYNTPHDKLAVLFLEARVFASRIQPSGEHDEYRWIDQNKITLLDFSDEFRRFFEDCVLREFTK